MRTRRVSIGFIAQGRVAIGLVAVGGVAIGVVAIGGVALGVLAIGGIALGGLALGGVAIGWKAIGAVAVGASAAIGPVKRIILAAGSLSGAGSGSNDAEAVKGSARATRRGTPGAESPGPRR